jgi:hypothetical protein
MIVVLQIKSGLGILPRLVGIGSGIGWYVFGLFLGPFLLWPGKVVKQPLFLRLIGNQCSKCC